MNIYPAVLASLLCLLLFPLRAGEWEIEAESGGLWFSRNEARIPGDDGTKFDMLDLTGEGPDLYLRLYASYAFNEKHLLRLTYAPVETEGTGTLEEEVRFEDTLFAPGLPTKGTYQFNTYRLTYRWTFFDDERWTWAFGAAALVRDADIALEQGELKENRDDLGLVPLLHFYGSYELSERWSLVLDAEGAWSPVGRAFDVALLAEYHLDSGMYLSAGYRTLEGGADNDDVFTFAWLHYAALSVGLRF